MKKRILIFLVFCCLTSLSYYSQARVEKNRRDKEKIEIAYIQRCMANNQKLDSLIEWKFSAKDETRISFHYKRDRLVYFVSNKFNKGAYLKELVYLHRSFVKVIFVNNDPNIFEINNKTCFRVLMSKDKLSIYFCLINADNNYPTIWVLTNGTAVYSVNP